MIALTHQRNPAAAGVTLVVKSELSIVTQRAATMLLEPVNFSKHFRFWFPVTWVLKTGNFTGILHSRPGSLQLPQQFPKPHPWSDIRAR